MVRWPARRRRPAPPPAPERPEGWPGWLPVGGGISARDFIPTHRFWDVLRLFHHDPTLPPDAAWPDPVLPQHAMRSLCDTVGRAVAAIARPDEVQAATLLDALGTGAPVHAIIGVTGGAALEEARTRGWPVVDATLVQPDLATQQVAFARELSRAQAVDLLAHSDVSHMCSDDWVVRCDPTGESSSSIVAGTSGTAERLRLTGLAVLPVGHASVWPPVCATCDPQAAAAAHEHHDHP